jgi:hypothetical protein
MPAALSKPAKRAAGRTAASATPLTIRSDDVDISETLTSYVRERSGRKLGKLAYHTERVTVRFLDVNGPRGGVDIECRIKIVLSSAPSIFVAKRAKAAREAFDVAADTAARALRRTVRARGWSEGGAGERAARRRRPATPERAPFTFPLPPGGSLIGRRVGQSAENLRRAAERPEKLRRDFPVDTAEPGRSASDRRAGAGSTAARNSKLRAPGATAALEDSAQDQPSRKSTRRSSGRRRQDNPLYLHKRRGLQQR